MTEYNTIFSDITCVKCKKQSPPICGELHAFHGYKLSCSHCRKFWGWGGKLGVKDGDGRRNRGSRWSSKRVGVDYCQLCCRARSELFEDEFLETHHIIEIQDGGKDIPSNVWIVCSSCHHQIHNLREYYHSSEPYLTRMLA